MAPTTNSPGQRADSDGVVRGRVRRAAAGSRVRWWWLGAAMVFALGCVVALLWQEDEAPPAGVEAPAPLELPATPPRAAVPTPAAPASVPAVTPPGADSPPPAEGLALFRPGTKPIKRGLVVPDGFELPFGYVRHYQTMDDGRQLPPILTFHPDYVPLDANGHPVEIPEDRVVPPELAPPGMPLQQLEVPAPLPETEPTGAEEN